MGRGERKKEEKEGIKEEEGGRGEEKEREKKKKKKNRKVGSRELGGEKGKRSEWYEVSERFNPPLLTLKMQQGDLQQQDLLPKNAGDV